MTAKNYHFDYYSCLIDEEDKDGNRIPIMYVKIEQTVENEKTEMYVPYNMIKDIVAKTEMKLYERGMKNGL